MDSNFDTDQNSHKKIFFLFGIVICLAVIFFSIFLVTRINTLRKTSKTDKSGSSASPASIVIQKTQTEKSTSVSFGSINNLSVNGPVLAQVSFTPAPSIPTPTSGILHEISGETDSITLTKFTPEDIKLLGIIALPKNYKVQEEYKGIKLIHGESSFYDSTQSALIKRFIDQTPKKLLNPGPVAVITYNSGEIELGKISTTLINAVAFASGPYIFFNNKSFSQSTIGGINNDKSVDRVFFTFEHELVHIAQFNQIIDKLNKVTINEYAKKSQNWSDISVTSDIFSEFAKISGWEEDSRFPSSHIFKLSDATNAKTTDYGKSGIQEDMAESVAGIILTQDKLFSSERKSWVLAFLNENYEDLKKGKFPLSDLYDPVVPKNIKYDEVKAKEFSSHYTLIDTQAFYTKSKDKIDLIEDYVNKELNSRSWSGVMGKNTDKHNVVTYQGEYKGNNRDIYIEVKSYDNATGYSIKPDGTTIYLLNGYKI